MKSKTELFLKDLPKSVLQMAVGLFVVLVTLIPMSAIVFFWIQVETKLWKVIANLF